MKKTSGQHWGWGFHIDLDGNLRDVFPPAKKEKDAPKTARLKWHVKKKVKKAFAGV